MSGKHWIIVLIILISSYGVYNGIKDKNSQKERWTAESAKILTNKCISDSKEMAENYAGLTHEYCKCSTEKIQAEFTQSEYIEITKLSIENQTKKLLPVFQSCFEYQKYKKNMVFLL